MTLRSCLTGIAAFMLCWSWQLRSSSGCPFCLAPPETLSEIFAGADVVLVGEMLRMNLFDQQIKADISATTEFRIRAVFKAPGTDHDALSAIRRTWEFPEVHSQDALLHNVSPGAENPQSSLTADSGRSANSTESSVFEDSSIPDSIRPGRMVTVPGYTESAPGELFLLVGRYVATPDSNGSSTFEITSAGDTAEKEADSVTTANLEADAQESIRVPFGQNLIQASFVVPELLEWDAPEPLTMERMHYLFEAPAPELPQQLRLPYYLAHLESTDTVIAVDAWAEFAGAKYEEVAAVRSSMSRDRLRSWIADPNANPERLGLYGMMLGLCGNASDAEFLREQIGTPNSGKSFRYGVEGLMGGYLLLTGDAGVAFLEDTRLRRPGVASEELFAVVQSLQFIWSYENLLISRPRLRAALHLLLDNEDMREVIIADLARWKDWPTAYRLQETFQTAGQDDDRSRKAIVRFMIALIRDADRDTGLEKPAPELVDSTRQFLAVVEMKYPQLLQTAWREFGPPQ